MSSGKNHDKATKLLTLPFGIAVGLIFGTQYGILSALAFLVGGYWLSPDLDTHSNALKRWGLIQILWWPYRKVISHRSIFSHGPIIGTGLRLFYLMGFGLIMNFLLHPLGLPSPSITLIKVSEYIQQNPKPICTALLSLEASAWLHLIQDGDPLPTI